MPAEILLGVGTALAGVEKQLEVALALRDNRAVRLAVLDGCAARLVEFAHTAGWGRITADGFAFGRDTRLQPFSNARRSSQLTRVRLGWLRCVRPGDERR